jgi:hypothetical protein
MPTIIDSLVVSLGLDGSKFVAGQKDAEASMAKTKAAALKQSAELETANKKFADSFNYIKVQAAELFAVIAGTSSIKAFITDVTTATAALGRLSVNLGVQPQEVGAWGLAIERVGGQANEAAGDFQELSTQLFNLKQNGQNLPVGIQRLIGASGDRVDTEHGIVGYLKSIGKAVEDFQKRGGSRSDAFNFLKQSGIGPGMAQLLLDNGSAIEKYVGSLKDLAPTDDQIKKFEALQTAFFTLQQTLTNLGRELVANFAEPMEKAATALTDFLTANQKTATGAVFSWLTTLRDDAQAVADVLNKIVDAQNWIAAHSLGKLGGALADKFGPPKTAGSGEATPIPWGAWGSGALKWFGDNWGIKAAGAADFGPGFGQGSHPHPASGLFVQGQQVSRGNPMPVTIVAGTETGSGGGFWNWLTGGGSPTSSGGGSGGGGGGDGGGGDIFTRTIKKITRTLLPSGSPGGGGNKGVGGWWTPERIQHAADRLQKEAGLSEMGAAGLVARWAGIEAPGGPTAVNPTSGAAGINQALGSRKPAGYAGWSFDQQLDYIIKTDLPSERRAYEQLKTAKTMGDAARGGSMYERAEQYNPVTGIDSQTANTPVGRILRILHGARGDHVDMPHRPVSHSPLSTMSALHPVTTSTTSNAMHVGDVHVHGVDSNNAHSVASRITDALRQSAMTTSANFGQA